MCLAATMGLCEQSVRAEPARPQPQAPAAAPSERFEVASVKPTPPPGPGWRSVGCQGGPGTTDPGLFHCTEINLSNLISMAFGLEGYQFPGRDSFERDVYDISAKVPPGATRQQFDHMLQNLLIERFKLPCHYQKKEMPVYALVVAKGGIKMKESPPENPQPADPAAADQAPAPPQPKTGLDRDGYPSVPPALRGRPSFPRFLSGRARWATVDTTMPGLSKTLTSLSAFSRLDASLVTDATGLAGKYDFALSWVYDADEAARVSPNFAGPSLDLALQQQLGLRLERRKSMVDVFTVDHVEQPSGN